MSDQRLAPTFATISMIFWSSCDRLGTADQTRHSQEMPCVSETYRVCIDKKSRG